jgi:predicted nucleic acid-binding protein
VTPRLVLDAEAVSRLASPGRRAEVKAALAAALRLCRDVVTPAVVLAELYRGPRLNQVIDGLLARETAIAVRDTDRTMARLVGGVLAAADAGSEHMVDAHVVATAVEAGGGTLLTGDLDDLERLAAAYPHVHVAPV